MGRRGEKAREIVVNTITQAFGNSYLGIQDKKIFVKAKDEGGEEIQFSISITMPKNGFAGATVASNPNDWNDIQAAVNNAPPQLTEKDQQIVADLMKELGIEE